MIKIMTYRSEYVFAKRPELAEYLEEHLNNLADESAPEDIGSGMVSDLQCHRPMIMFVAWDCGVPVAWASVSFHFNKKRFGQIGCYVHPKYRRQGIGSRLVVKAKAWCTKNNFKPHSNAWDRKGRSFYKLNGIPDGTKKWAYYDYRAKLPV